MNLQPCCMVPLQCSPSDKIYAIFEHSKGHLSYILPSPIINKCTIIQHILSREHVRSCAVGGEVHDAGGDTAGPRGTPPGGPAVQPAAEDPQFLAEHFGSQSAGVRPQGPWYSVAATPRQRSECISATATPGQRSECTSATSMTSFSLPPPSPAFLMLVGNA
jgi:hypothetical protein